MCRGHIAPGEVDVELRSFGAGGAWSYVGSYAEVSPEPVRRFEVFTGEGGRRRWSTEEKLSLVAEMGAVDNISDLARRHGLRASQLFTWRRELRYATEAAAQPTFVPALIEPAVVPIAAERPTSQKRRRTRRSRPTGTAIELEIDGVAVKIAQGVSGDLRN